MQIGRLANADDALVGFSVALYDSTVSGTVSVSQWGECGASRSGAADQLPIGKTGTAPPTETLTD